MTLLTDIQAIADRYAAARTGYDAAWAAGDKGKMVLYEERLNEAGTAWRPLAQEFEKKYTDIRSPIDSGMTVVWKRGAIGLQGAVISAIWASDGGETIVQVHTPLGVFAEYAGNLMPLAVVGDP